MHSPKRLSSCASPCVQDKPEDPRAKADMEDYLKEKRKDMDTRSGGVYIPPFRHVRVRGPWYP